MKKTIDETNRRREKQMKYNEEHGITPRQIKRALSSALSKEITATAEARAYVEPDYSSLAAEPLAEMATPGELKAKIEQAVKAMLAAMEVHGSCPAARSAGDAGRELTASKVKTYNYNYNQ